MNILLTNPGRRTYIISFLLDLQESIGNLTIHLADCNEYSASKFVSPLTQNHLVPPVLDDGNIYIQSILDLCVKYNVDIVFPLSDLDLYLLSTHKSDFLQVGCNVIVSDSKFIKNCFNKLLFNKFCLDNNILTPRIITNINDWSGDLPIVKKHILGSGSSGLMMIDSPSQFSLYDPSLDCLQECIYGQEYGIDILNDLHGNFVSACVKKKILLRSGETDIAQVVDSPNLTSFASHLATITQHIGNLDCDVIVDKNMQIYSIDFNPRIGGGYPATHLSGFNYLNAIISMVMTKSFVLPPSPQPLTVIKGISLHSS